MTCQCGASREECEHYSIDVYDCAGHFDSIAVTGRDAAKARFDAEREKWRGKSKVVMASRPDHVDLDDDGLTEDERDCLFC